jgi:hypothetical protein
LTYFLADRRTRAMRPSASLTSTEASRSPWRMSESLKSPSMMAVNARITADLPMSLPPTRHVIPGASGTVVSQWDWKPTRRMDVSRSGRCLAPPSGAGPAGMATRPVSGVPSRRTMKAPRNILGSWWLIRRHWKPRSDESRSRTLP